MHSRRLLSPPAVCFQPVLARTESSSLVYGSFSALFGLAVGSFVNVVVHRLPHGGAASLSGRSHCPRCNASIGWKDNVPLLSWAILGGRCRSCRAPISSRYPLVELLCAALFVLAWREAPQPEYTVRLVILWVALAALLALAVIDLDLRILPDEITIGGMVLGPVAVVFAPEILSGTWSFAQAAPWIPNDRLRAIATSFAGIAVGAGTVGAIRALGTRAYSSTADHAVSGGESSGRLDAFLASQKPRHGRRQVRTWIEEGLVSVVPSGGSAAARVARDPAERLAPGDVVRVRTVREAMGLGDVKLQGAVGALVGPEGSLLALAIASVAGAVVGGGNLVRIATLLRLRGARRRRAPRRSSWSLARVAGGTIPFGPFLAAGAASVLVARARVVDLLTEIWPALG